MGYILSEKKDTNCIFCPGADRSKDADRLILCVGERSMVMMNRYPYNNGHLLVSPVRHVPGMEQLNHKDLLDLLLTVRRSIGILRKVMAPQGFNVGLNLGHVAGAGVEEHMHFHIVPRWNGDTNYMTVLDDIRVIPEHIRKTYGKLRPDFMRDHADGGR
jgi:ATP adenylyltransferase